jgi:DMSO/TMAO reductase YedYZ molybdopterin-dependent catalytic subunit
LRVIGRQSRSPHDWLSGAVAASAQLGAGELLAALTNGRSPASGLGRTLIDAVPGPGIDIIVATAEAKDKPLLLGTLIANWLGLGALAGRIEARRPGGGRALLVAQGTVAGVAAASRPEASTPFSLAAGIGGGLAGAAALRPLGDRVHPARLVGIGGLAAAAGGVAWVLRRRRKRAVASARELVALPRASRPAPPLPAGAQLDIPRLTSLFTPPEDFYVTDVVLPAPQVDPRKWRLRIKGLVEEGLELRLDELLDMDLVELDATLVCVHNPVGGPRIGTARWLGVPIADLLARTGRKPGAEQLLARSVDGFTAGIPVELIDRGGAALVAVGMNGEPLPVANGFPARLLVPGLWGADASTKWIGELELTTWAAVEDYWDSRGWPRWPTPVRPGSRIDVPAHRSHVAAGTVTVAGVAWAPPEGVERVEVSIDGGGWEAAALSAEIAPTAWRQWRHAWDAEPGEHRLRVRSIGRGGPQPGQPAPPFPGGSAGYHETRAWVDRRPAQAPSGTWRSRLGDGAADAARRIKLAATAPPAWMRHGYPGELDFPDPAGGWRGP